MVRQFKDGMHDNLPAEAFEVVPPQLLDQITSNPNALINSGASESLMGAFAANGESGVALGESVFAAIRESLAGAIGDVFFLAFIFVALAVVATVFIREVPLRKRGGPPPGDRPGSTPDSHSGTVAPESPSSDSPAS
jgi:hypothetical protein